MQQKHKIEFFSFQLNPKDEETTSFKKFAISELKAKETETDAQILNRILKYFIKSLDSDLSKNERLKKEIKLVKTAKNKYKDFKPKTNSDKHIISGVINGGFFGKDGIAIDEESELSIHRKMSILYYYYIFIYTPLDYDKGFVIIHSNSKEETITNICKPFIEKIFKGQNFKNSKTNYFTPKVFQNEFLNNSYLSHITFNKTVIDSFGSRNGVTNKLGKYKVRLVITPDSDDEINYSGLKKDKDYFGGLIFGRKDINISLNNFENSSVTLDNGSSEKTFNWNVEQDDFVPVVYLKDRILRYNADGTPDFAELDEYCIKLFENEILEEFRPDLYVTRIE